MGLRSLRLFRPFILRRLGTKVSQKVIKEQIGVHDLLREIQLRTGVDKGPRQERSRRKLAQIKRAAIKIIARDGIAATRIADVAAEASITSSSVYDFYSNKEELAYSISVDNMSLFYGELAEAFETIDSAKERLMHYMGLTFDFAQRDPDWARIFYLEVFPSIYFTDPKFRSILDDYARVIVYLVQDGAARSEWTSPVNVQLIVSIVVGSMHHLIVNWLIHREPRNIAREGKKMIDLLIDRLLVQASS